MGLKKPMLEPMRLFLKMEKDHMAIGGYEYGSKTKIIDKMNCVQERGKLLVELSAFLGDPGENAVSSPLMHSGPIFFFHKRDEQNALFDTFYNLVLLFVSPDYNWPWSPDV